VTLSKNAIFRHSLEAYILPLADCGGGCYENLVKAIGQLPIGIKMVNNSKHADLVFIAGVITHAAAPRLKEEFAGLSKPCFVVKIGACMGKANKRFEDPSQNYAVSEMAKKFFPINLAIEGCPPTVDEIVSKLETFINYLDLTPEISKTLDEKIDKSIFSP
jgi:Ni,Fe-hydrogenase III small subunit